MLAAPLRFAAFAAAFLISLPALAAEVPQVKQAIEAQERIQRYRLQSVNCRWATPVADLITEADFRLSTRLLEGANKAARNAKAKPPQFAQCDSEQDRQTQFRTVTLMWEWMTRLAILNTYVRQPGWSEKLLAIPDMGIGGNEGARLGYQDHITPAFGRDVIDQRVSALQQESVLVLNVLCVERRRAVKLPSDICPSLRPGLIDQLPLARMRAEEAEKVAAELDNAFKRQARDELGPGYRVPTSPSDRSSACKLGDRTVYPGASDTKATLLPGQQSVTIHSHGGGSNLGRATVRSTDKGGLELFIAPALGIKAEDARHPVLIACTSY